MEPDGTGPSAELLSPNLNNNDGANWKASTTATSSPAVFASPGVVEVIDLPTISFTNSRTLVQESADTIAIPVKVDNLNVALAEARVEVISFSTAVENEDYILLDTLVAFPAGTATPFEIKLIILDDSIQRNSRYLILRLSDFTAAEGGATVEHAILIHDDDTPAPQPQAKSPVSIQYLSSFSVDPVRATAEISAYDPASKRLFTTNIQQNRLEIRDFKNPAALSKITSVDIGAYGGGINSVAFYNSVVAVAIDDTLITNPGKVVFFDVNGGFLSALTVGALPDHVIFTPDGTKLLVANEGEPATDYSVDPEGSVSVIDMTPGPANLTQANVIQIGFAQFEGDIDALRAAGVRVFGPTDSLSKNLEPEYITVSEDGHTAWVTLQEANALAVIDLQNNVISAILPLGLKNWNTSGLDASDQVPGVFFNNWNIKGMYQPDAISYWNSGGNGFLITANEGDVREWDAYAEIVRVGSSAYPLDSLVFPDAAYLKRPDLLGRLNVTTATGDTDGDGDFDEIHTFGGRSISIWNAATGALVWDSGDDLERITAADPVFGPIFNASNTNNTRKNRSDDKGPEPEGIALGAIEGRNYAFSTLERMGGVMMYDVTDPAVPAFVQWINTRNPVEAGGDQGPEGLLFIPKNDSPNGRNLLVVSNENSGSISVFQINIDKTQTGAYSLTKYAFDNNPVIGVYGDSIREGGISGLMYRDGSFRFVGDRGPNADAINHPMSGGKTTLVFPFPDYAPKVWQVKPNNGVLEVEDFDFIKRPDGTGASGLPLPAGQGNTGEVAWSDTSATLLSNDPWGLDSEGLAQDNEGNFWLCDEYGTSIWKLDPQFKVLNRYTPFPKETADLPLDTLLGKRRANRGLEGIAYTPNGKIFAILQSPADNPNTTTGNTSRIHRFVELDPATGAMRTFVYVHEPVLGEIRSRDWKIGDLTAINNEEFLVVEHAERNGWNAKNVYKINIADATPVSSNNFGGNTLEQLNESGLTANGIVPVQKQFFADLLELGWDRRHDKPEGLAILNDSTFAVINDNDFGIASPSADGKIELTGKTTRLYVYTLPSDKHLDYVSPYCKLELGQNVSTCANGTATLIAGGDPFTQFTWSNGENTPAIEVDSAGVYILQAVNAFGCKSADTVTVTVLPVSTSSINASACKGEVYVYNGTSIPAGTSQQFLFANSVGCDSVVTIAVAELSVSASTLNVSACMGSSYEYLGAFIPAGQNQQFILTNIFGCDSVVTVQVASDPLPVVDLGQDSTICEGQTLTLDAGNTGATYNWSNSATTQTISTGTGGAYAVTVTNNFGCTDSDAVLVNVELCSGTEEPALSQISVFPNPTSGILTVQLVEMPARASSLTLVNSTGQIVIRSIPVNDLTTALDLSGLPKGMYLLRFQSGTGVHTIRIAVQ
ncbi:MAG: choice-of-anchor I family protein [Lewinellaceae bacterium]|nr:choice-of-anchor I family protein [Lewinellaceae bacterium]